MEESELTKVEAIYRLREAVEAKVHAEQAVAADSTSLPARDALLEAQLDVEAKTQDAIDVCHECDHSHADDEPHVTGRVIGERDNVVHVAFGNEAESA